MSSYVSYWNLREKPFQNVSNTRFAYLSDQHREGLARLLYVAEGRKLGGLLVGPYGVGKSMVLELLAEQIRTRGDSLYVQIDATPLGTLAMARQIAQRLNCREPIAEFTDLLNFISEQGSAARPQFTHLVLAIDEAQLLREPGTYEFFHLLTNLRSRAPDAGGDSLVTLILCGHQNLLQNILNDASLRQRMQMFWELEPLTEGQTVEYVHHRIRAAGGDIWVFDDDALREIHAASQGLPRMINNICDVALLIGCAMGATRVSRDVAQRAAQETQSEAILDPAAGQGATP